MVVSRSFSLKSSDPLTALHCLWSQGEKAAIRGRYRGRAFWDGWILESVFSLQFSRHASAFLWRLILLFLPFCTVYLPKPLEALSATCPSLCYHPGPLSQSRQLAHLSLHSQPWSLTITGEGHLTLPSPVSWGCGNKGRIKILRICFSF